MPAGHHTDDWFRTQNAATGQPPGARHSDQWYQREIARRQAEAVAQAQAPADHNAQLQRIIKEQQYQALLQREAAQQAAAQAPTPPATPPPPPPPPPGPTAAEIAAAEALAQTNAKARRDDWDRMNNQGAYDADGWQSIGLQPDYIGMPDWWRDAVAPPAPLATAPTPAQNSLDTSSTGVPPTAEQIASAQNSRDTSRDPPPGFVLTPTGLERIPAAAAGWGQAPSTGVPPTAEQIASAQNSRDTSRDPPPGFVLTPTGLERIPAAAAGWGQGPTATNRSGAPNALSQLFGPDSTTRGASSLQQPTQPMSWGSGGPQQPTAPARTWGAWGQRPTFTQQPDAGAWGQPDQPRTSRPQSWAQPAGQSNSGFGAPNQGLQSWTQPARQRRQPGVWGQQTQPGTWGSGRL